VSTSAANLDAGFEEPPLGPASGLSLAESGMTTEINKFRITLPENKNVETSIAGYFIQRVFSQLPK
jgi:hypothetical protein